MESLEKVQIKDLKKIKEKTIVKFRKILAIGL